MSPETNSQGNTRMLSLMLCLGFGSLFGAVRTSAQVASAAPSHAVDTSAALRPGDLIRLRIWREPDFSGDFPVDETGVVVLPRLGALNVTAEPPDSLKARLVRGYRTFLNHSSIDVVFLRRVQIVGAVQKPGLYHVDPIMTVGDALALAGGVLPGGREDKVEIIREGGKLPGTLSGRMVISHSPVRSGDQLYVPERSWVSRNPGVIIGGISAVSALLYVVVR
jgi:protein involved in polysaccharide export with SLBB domain